MISQSPFGENEFAARAARVRERMRADGLDAVIAYSNAKAKGCVRYLSNYFVRFTGAQTRRDGGYFQFGSCALLFPADGEPRLLTDQPWDIERAKEMSLFSDTAYAENFGTDFGERIARDGYKRVGIDNWFLFPAMHYLGLTELAPGAEYVPTQLIEDTYKIKSPREIELVRKAEDVAVKAIEDAFAAVGVGVPEFDFALACDYALRKYGDLEVAGSAIVAGGPNTATGSGLPTQESSYTCGRRLGAVRRLPGLRGLRGGHLAHDRRRQHQRPRSAAEGDVRRHPRDERAASSRPSSPESRPGSSTSWPSRSATRPSSASTRSTCSGTASARTSTTRPTTTTTPRRSRRT